MFRQLLLVSVVVAALGLTGCAGGTAAATSAPAAAAPRASVPTQDRTIYMAAVEWKSSRNVSQTAFPTESLPAGDGYVLVPPDADGNWVVETYKLDPGLVVVNQGDRVTLEIIAINGSEHTISVEGYNASTTVKRGHVSRITFTADQAGIFNITGKEKAPTMFAQLVVLSNP